MAVVSNCFHIFIDDNEYLTLKSYPALNLVPTLNEFTLSVWFFGILTAPAKKVLIAKATTNADQYAIESDGDGTNITVILGGKTQTFDILAALGYKLVNSVWHHVVVTCSLTTAKLYVDEVFVGPNIDLTTITNPECVPVDTLVGSHRDTDNTDYVPTIRAEMDEIAIWNAELSAAAVATLTSIASSHIVDPRINTGSYDKADDLIGFWRCGDGGLENAGTAGALPDVSDMSQNGHTGELHQLGVTHPTPNDMYTDVSTVFDCDSPFTQFFDSSSSAFIDIIPPHFNIKKEDEGAPLMGADGFPNIQKRSHFTCTSSDLKVVDENIFVYEYGRPVPGTSLRNAVFRRVASLRDLQTLPVGAENRQAAFPHAFRYKVATVYARTQEEIDQAWIEIQRQARGLVLDMTEFGNPALGVDQGGELRGGVGAAVFDEDERFFLPFPPSLGESSSSIPAFGSSSSSFAGRPHFFKLSSSSSVFLIPTSSSSLFVDPFLFTETIFLNDPLGADAAARLDDDGTRTMFTDLGFLRFGRDPDPLRTWDSLVRFRLSIPKCAEILSAVLWLPVHTTERGSDVVLKIRDIYKDAGYSPVDAFSGTTDHLYRKEVVWDRLPAVSIIAGNELNSPELSSLLQFFVDRPPYTPGVDHFGLWLAEITSDPGARRDASISALAPYLKVTYRTDGSCPTSSSSSS